MKKGDMKAKDSAGDWSDWRRKTWSGEEHEVVKTVVGVKPGYACHGTRFRETLTTGQLGGEHS